MSEQEHIQILASKGCNNSKGRKCMAGPKKRATRLSICAGITCKIDLQ